jgi:hypothetical protein
VHPVGTPLGCGERTHFICIESCDYFSGKYIFIFPEKDSLQIPGLKPKLMAAK